MDGKVRKSQTFDGREKLFDIGLTKLQVSSQPHYRAALAMTTATGRETSPKIYTGLIVTIFDCPILFVFYVVGKARYKWIGARDVKLNTEN